jgi:hypothetical protein
MKHKKDLLEAIDNSIADVSFSDIPDHRKECYLANLKDAKRAISKTKNREELVEGMLDMLILSSMWSNINSFSYPDSKE